MVGASVVDVAVGATALVDVGEVVVVAVGPVGGIAVRAGRRVKGG